MSPGYCGMYLIGNGLDSCQQCQHQAETIQAELLVVSCQYYGDLKFCCNLKGKQDLTSALLSSVIVWYFDCPFCSRRWGFFWLFFSPCLLSGISSLSLSLSIVTCCVSQRGQAVCVPKQESCTCTLEVL